MIDSIENHKKMIKHDGTLPIATGKSRHEKNWKNKQLPWSHILAKLETPTITPETYSEYMAMSKAEQDRIKDVGGFVGGSLKNGRRRQENVQTRQLLTLDADFADPGLVDELDLLLDYGYAYYSTHKHSPKKPRLRLLIPLNREVTPDEYEAIGRKVAEEIGIDIFDDTTYQPNRMMFLPSVSSDAEYLFDYYDAPWLDADNVLAKYSDWTDISYWPESSRVKKERKKKADKQGDPLEKSGLIGAFCRTYSIREAIDTFLYEVYEPCATDDRYTYKEGSTAAGLVLYDDKFAYSNHATDPAGQKLCNAFDLVRIHKFGQMDEDIALDTTVTKLPSYKEMMEFVQKDKGVVSEIVREKKKDAEEEFGEVDNWETLLEVTERGIVKNSLLNISLIMERDPELKNIVYNEMSENLEVIGKIPWAHTDDYWRDADEAQLEIYLARRYAEFSKGKIQTSVTKVADDRSYHPIKEYLAGLPKWDKVLRVDRLLIDYLGAEDTSYAKAVIRKFLCAAIARIHTPGCKFDTMPVLGGPQGIGKSTLPNRLGMKWYTDSLSLADTKDKTAAEKLQGNWMIEIPELVGMRKSDEETLKSFISRGNDKYRVAYGKQVTPHPRHSVFIGTTNADMGYLRDVTGGRRFWPVECSGDCKKKPWELTQDDVDQIWAEALVYYEAGESLILDKEEEEIANEKRKEAIESDPREGQVFEYLETKLPTNWDSLDTYERRDFLHGNAFGTKQGEGTITRDYVSTIEIWSECFKKPPEDFDTRKGNDIAKIIKKLGWESEGRKVVRIKLYGPVRRFKRQ